MVASKSSHASSLSENNRIMDMKKIRVVFVCMGNICRSPTAHGVFETKLQEHKLDHLIDVDSAGTHAYHIGEPADRRSQQTASKRGYQMDHLRARKVTGLDFEQFDYVLAMDDDNYRNLESICPPIYSSKLQMFLDFSTKFDEREVPDPYYGGAQGFEHVLDLIEDASEGLIRDIRERLSQ
ncbi:MAG: low molecular weight phosphotyrosine protein phosphatase [Gammaproteobacteria bacterium]|nr:low molecular weight phosphotyrosine protein phosphatase [Gammaproteobacteria bacterium]